MTDVGGRDWSNCVGTKGCGNDLWVRLLSYWLVLLSIVGVTDAPEYCPDEAFRIERRRGGAATKKHLMFVIATAYSAKLLEHVY